MIESQFSTDDEARHPLPSDLIHDLCTPLNLIIGYSEMLLEQAQEQGQNGFVSDLQITLSAGKQLLALINDNFHAIHALEIPDDIAHPLEENSMPIGQPLAAEEFPEDAVAGEVLSGAPHGFFLIVDDIKANRDVLSRRLQRQGHAVATAENGRQALEMLRADTFDLVLLDIIMPEMDGYEVLEHLKADPTLSHLPVIMISALSELNSVVRCIEMGAEDYLTQPFNATLLKARIGASLEKKRARDRETLLFEQLEKNYQRLQELERVRDDLTHMIIHDLRSPLNTVFLGISELEEVGDLNAAQREMVDITLGGGQTMLGIINDLLDINKMESGSLQLERQETTAGDLIDAAVKQCNTQAHAQNLTLAVKLEPGLPPLLADGDKLLRALVNLLSNAIKFTPGPGTVTVSARLGNEEPSLRFSVTDTGEGIPSESFGRIFEKFGQVESRQGGRKMSTGLGLAFCKLAVEAHGGHIGVQSVPGQGSTFSFTIPLGSASAFGSASALEVPVSVPVPV
jgi:two-component system sensor histidine kinase/response regulator